MRTGQEQSLPRLVEFMADNMSYASNQYIPAHPQYYAPPHVNHGHGHVISAPPRPEPTQRKRPKYTRSKTGCMTCRVKKIKCDETKPNCMRCTHGQRDCTWPEGVPARKKSIVRKDSGDGRPSTAGSSGLSEASTPPTREHTPPRRSSSDIGLVPVSSRRLANEPYLLHPMASEPEPTRRLPINNDRQSSSGYSHHPISNPNALNMIPETTSYSSQSRYEHAYSNNGHSSRHAGFRPLNHEPVAWNGSSEYQYTPQDRGLMTTHIPSDTHTRYQ
ncbi:hypothetical protein Hypma_007697 [Hypsizygus marmoreus]|uniref:Zn(2)-C6 fungal-type domain-containing protein n=1 Tax=Hypsizygus marmoreus TaxID=39966 RepID=A0A369K1E5_HYPMA|nr:hypothetical protein Hypma_007697 [Hypsizygus marmoreus]